MKDEDGEDAKDDDLPDKSDSENGIGLLNAGELLLRRQVLPVGIGKQDEDADASHEEASHIPRHEEDGDPLGRRPDESEGPFLHGRNPVHHAPERHVAGGGEE